MRRSKDASLQSRASAARHQQQNAVCSIEDRLAKLVFCREPAEELWMVSIEHGEKPEP